VAALGVIVNDKVRANHGAIRAKKPGPRDRGNTLQAFHDPELPCNVVSPSQQLSRRLFAQNEFAASCGRQDIRGVGLPVAELLNAQRAHIVFRQLVTEVGLQLGNVKFVPAAKNNTLQPHHVRATLQPSFLSTVSQGICLFSQIRWCFRVNLTLALL
jgi:hypothetical protein